MGSTWRALTFVLLSLCLGSSGLLFAISRDQPLNESAQCGQILRYLRKIDLVVRSVSDLKHSGNLSEAASSLTDFLFDPDIQTFILKTPIPEGLDDERTRNLVRIIQLAHSLT